MVHSGTVQIKSRWIQGTSSLKHLLQTLTKCSQVITELHRGSEASGPRLCILANFANLMVQTSVSFLWWVCCAVQEGLVNGD